MSLAREARREEELGKPGLWRLLGELELVTEPARRPFRRLEVKRARNPSTIMILPGFATAPRRMRYLAQHLELAGHQTKSWGTGYNWGPDEALFSQLDARLAKLHARTGEKLVLLGWSLGGIFARELAKRNREAVTKVITMGTPFSGSLRANNAWRLYQFVTGTRVDEPPIKADIPAKPPVETVAMWSARDGAIAPHSAAGLPGERDRAIPVSCTHSGYTYSREAIEAVLTELDRA
ncbi:MAG: alpha/beta hydrolase [Pseudomonadota bacterium]